MSERKSFGRSEEKTTQFPSVSAPVNNGTFHLCTWLEMCFWYQVLLANDFLHSFESVLGPVYKASTMRTSMLNTVRSVMRCCLALFHKRETQESLKGRSQHSVNTGRYFSLFLPAYAAECWLDDACTRVGLRTRFSWAASWGSCGEKCSLRCPPSALQNLAWAQLGGVFSVAGLGETLFILQVLAARRRKLLTGSFITALQEWKQSQQGKACRSDSVAFCHDDCSLQNTFCLPSFISISIDGMSWLPYCDISTPNKFCCISLISWGQTSGHFSFFHVAIQTSLRCTVELSCYLQCFQKVFFSLPISSFLFQQLQFSTNLSESLVDHDWERPWRVSKERQRSWRRFWSISIMWSSWGNWEHLVWRKGGSGKTILLPTAPWKGVVARWVSASSPR